MYLARIVDGVVVNVEKGDEEWLAAHTNLVPFDETNPAHIGLLWSEIHGFQQPKPDPFPDAIEDYANGSPAV